MNIQEILVQENASMKNAMRVINNAGTRLAVVVDEGNKLKGIITDGDIRRAILNGASIQKAVGKVMNDSPIYSNEKMSEEEILKKLRDNDVTGMPLVDADLKVKDFIILKKGSEVSSLAEREDIINQVENVLVIGGAGYIGSVLVRKLLDKEYNVTILDKFIYGKESIEDIKNHPNLRIIEGDTRHIETIIEGLKDAHAVIHLAELVGDPACAHDPQKTTEINYLATKTIASLCKHFHISRFVYSSSCSVYGSIKNADDLLTENSDLNPVSLYAQTKIEAENILLSMKDEAFQPTILRLGTVFGPSPRMRFDLVINLLAAKAKQEGKITIFGGEQWRPFVHVEDAAAAFVAAMEAPLSKAGGEIFNVTRKDLNIQIKDLIPLYQKHHPEVNIDLKEDLTDRRDYKVSAEKLAVTLGHIPEKTLEDGIREIIDLFKNGRIPDYKKDVYSNIKVIQNSFLSKRKNV